MIRVQETAIPLWIQKNIVLLADMHLGIYKDEKYLQRVVDRVNALSWIDLIVIAWDFTFEPTASQTLDTLFAPLAQFTVPVYAVLGNHDVQKPWPDLTQALIATLKKYHVNLLENDRVNLWDSYLVGLDSMYTEQGDVSLLQYPKDNKPVIALTHNPDMTLSYTAKARADLTLAGHTHGGQIRIPWLYRYVIPTRGDFDRGFSHERLTQLYISVWLGEVILPMRLFNPPTIDVIHLY